MKFRGDKATERMMEYSNLIKIVDTPNKAMNMGNQKENKFYGLLWMLNKKTDKRFVNDVIGEFKDLKIRSDWDDIKVWIMFKAVYHKFIQFQNLKEELLSLPDNCYFVEHRKNDKIWADGGDGGSGEKGKNYLGKILTFIRFFLKYGDFKRLPEEIRKKIDIFNTLLEDLNKVK